MPIDKSKLRKETREEAMYSFNNPLVWLGRTMEDEPFKSDKPLKFINPPKPPKITKDKNIMKARSDIKNKDGKISIDTEMNIKKGLEPKVKRALKKSVIGELDKKIIGSGIRKIEFELSSDSSSDDDNDIGNGIKGGLVYGYYKPKNPVQPKHILVPNIKYQKKP